MISDAGVPKYRQLVCSIPGVKGIQPARQTNFTLISFIITVCDQLYQNGAGTELIWTAEETPGVEDSYFESEENALSQAVAMMSKIHLQSDVC